MIARIGVGAIALSTLSGLAVGQAGDGRFGASSLGQILTVGSDGETVSIFEDEVDTPRGMALAPDGTVFVSVTGGLGGEDGFILRINPDGTSEEFLTGVSPFDIEVNPETGDLFVSDASQGAVLQVPTSGPAEGVPSVFASGFTPSGLSFASDGTLFAGMQPTAPGTAGTAGLARITSDGAVTQVGILDSVFDVEVDASGNVFANEVLADGTFGEGSGGVVSVFMGLAAGDAAVPSTPIESVTFSETTIRAVAIGPEGTDAEGSIFVTTGSFEIIEFDAEDLAEFEAFGEPVDGEVFAGPPVSDIGSPFDFVIVDLGGGEFELIVATDDIPAPAGAVVIALAGVAGARRRR